MTTRPSVEGERFKTALRRDGYLLKPELLPVQLGGVELVKAERQQLGLLQPSRL